METLTKPRKIAIGVGAGLGLAGVAFAAVLLTTDFVGSTRVTDVNSSMRVEVSQTGSGGGMTCTASMDSQKRVTADLNARRVNGNIPEQSCTVFFRIYNTGAVPLTGLQFTSAGDGLGGYTVTPYLPQSVPANSYENAQVNFKTGGAGVTEIPAGAFTGKLTANAE